jgi:hypothetical protein
VRIGAEENGTGSYQAAMTFGTRSATSDAAPVERMRLTHNGQLLLTNGTSAAVAAGSVGLVEDGDTLEVRNANGVINIGPTNTSYAHITTDRARFYFNRDLVIGENAISSYNGDFTIRRNQSTDEQITIGDDSMTFTSAGNDVVTVDGTNTRVGIGTTSPSAKLDVVGTIECTGLSLQNGTLDYGGGKQQTVDLATGWYTFAYVEGRDSSGTSAQRAFGEFLINDVASSRHGSCRLNATHFFGSGNSIQVFAYNFFGTAVFNELRIKEHTTYSGAALQVYVSNATNNLETYMTMSEQTASWLLLDTWLADSDTSGHDAILGYATDSSSWTDFAAAETIDLSVFAATTQGGIYTSGGLKAETLFLGKTGTAGDYRLHPDSAGSGIVVNADGSDVTLRADDDLILHADDAIFFQSGGATKMTLLNDGNLGIGTTSPDAKLHVEGSVLIDAYEAGAGAGLFFREGFLNTNQPSITVQDHSGANPDGLAISAYDGISFRLNAVEKARFDSNGNLGIGTTSPGAILHVDKGSTVAPSLTFGATAGQIFQNENSEFAFGLDNNPPYSLWIQGRNSGNAARDISLQPLGGKIGIGTESPTASLDVAQGGAGSLMTIIGGADLGAATRTNDTRKFFRMGMPHYHNAEEPFNILCGDSSGTQNKVIIGGGTSLGNAATDILFNTAANDATTTGTTRMIIDESGNVGIGVIAPTDTLAVSGGIKIGEFNSTDGTGYAGTSPPSDHNNRWPSSMPTTSLAERVNLFWANCNTP